MCICEMRIFIVQLVSRGDENDQAGEEELSTCKRVHKVTEVCGPKR